MDSSSGSAHNEENVIVIDDDDDDDDDEDMQHGVNPIVIEIHDDDDDDDEGMQHGANYIEQDAANEEVNPTATQWKCNMCSTIEPETGVLCRYCYKIRVAIPPLTTDLPVGDSVATAATTSSSAAGSDTSTSTAVGTFNSITFGVATGIGTTTSTLPNTSSSTTTTKETDLPLVVIFLLLMIVLVMLMLLLRQSPKLSEQQQSQQNNHLAQPNWSKFWKNYPSCKKIIDAHFASEIQKKVQAMCSQDLVDQVWEAARTKKYHEGNGVFEDKPELKIRIEGYLRSKRRNWKKNEHNKLFWKP